jgi:CheY-like chemotaxis protein
VGSTFTVTLPLDAVEMEPDADAAVDLTGVRILSIFDDPMEGDFALRYVSRQGASAHTVQSLDEARAYTLSGNFVDVVIMQNGHDTVIEDMRSGLENLSFVILNHERSARKGFVRPGVVMVQSDPLSRRYLLKAVGLASGRLSEDAGTGRTKRKAPSINDARMLGQLILVAEDNLTNQDVIARQLSLLGYACEIASDGVEALKAWQSTGDYAALLTDCHMPNMDGYQLTQAIRQAESDGGRRIPIIAITANALQGEGERCLEIGMDDYLMKPLEMDKLEASLSKWVPLGPPPGDGLSGDDMVGHETNASTQTEAADGAVVDPRALKDIFGDDDDTFKEIMLEFIEPSEDIVREIMAGYQDHDGSAVGAAGHKLKSSSRAVGAYSLAEVCEGLENAGKSGNWPEIDKTIPELQRLLVDVTAYIKSL